MTVYLVETPKELFWSPRKMTSQYQHLKFLYKDRARYKEMEDSRFKTYCSTVKKKVIQLEES